MAVTSITGTFSANISGAFSANASRGGRFIASPGNNVNTSVVYEVQSDGTTVSRAILRGTGGGLGMRLNRVAVSKDGMYLVEIPYNNGTPPRVLKWNAANSRYEFLVGLAGSGYQTGADFSVDDTRLVVGGWAGLYVYNRSGDTFTLATTIPNDTSHLNSAQVENLEWSHNGQYILVGHRNGIQVYKQDGTRVYNAQADASKSGWSASWSLDDAYVISACNPIDTGVYVWSRSGDTFTWMFGYNAIWNIQAAAPPVAVEVAGAEYFMVVQGGATSDSQIRFFEKSTGYTTYKTMADLGFPSFTGMQNWALATSGKTADNYQYVYSTKGNSPYLQGWRIDLVKPALDVTSAIDFPKMEMAGTATIRQAVTSSVTFPMMTFSAAVAQDDAPATDTFDNYPIYLSVVSDGSEVTYGAAPPFVFADITFPKMETTGTIILGRGVFGDIDFPMMQIAGTLDMERVLTGDITFPMMEVTGALLNGRTVSGDIDFPMMELAGQIELARQVSGDIDFPMTEIAGTVGVLIQVSGDIDFPMMEIAAVSLNGFRLEGDIDFPMMEIDGAADQSHRFYGDIDFPMMELVGEIEQERAFSGDITFPMMLHESSAAVRYNIDSNITFPLMQHDGTVKLIAGILGDIDFPMMEIDGLLRPRINGQGSITFPMMQTDGYLFVGAEPEPGDGGTGMGTSGGGSLGAPSFRFGQNNKTRIG